MGTVVLTSGTPKVSSFLSEKHDKDLTKGMRRLGRVFSAENAEVPAREQNPLEKGVSLQRLPLGSPCAGSPR